MKEGAGKRPREKVMGQMCGTEGFQEKPYSVYRKEAAMKKT